METHIYAFKKDNEKKMSLLSTVKLYDASTSPVFLAVIVATPNWVRASNVGTVTLMIFPGLLRQDESICDFDINKEKKNIEDEGLLRYETERQL